MWVMTHFGILMPSLRPEKTYDPEQDPRAIQIRTRRSWELDYLRKTYAPWLGETIYLGDGVSDYQYRAYCTHEQLAEIMKMLSLEIDYTKFKPTTDRHGDTKLHMLYNRIWSAVLDAFPAGSSYDWPKPKRAPRGLLFQEPEAQPKRRLTRKEKRAAKKNGVRWQAAFDDVNIDVNTGHNEFAEVNIQFRKNWWEDM